MGCQRQVYCQANVAHVKLKITMSKLFRALMISAVATGVLALVLEGRQKQKPKTPTPSSNTSPEVDADALTSDQQDLLMKEMGAEF